MCFVWPLALVENASRRSPPNAIWFSTAVLFVAGVVIPAFLPRPFRPTFDGVSTPIIFSFVDAHNERVFQETPRLDQTASLISRNFVSWGDKIIFDANRKVDLTVHDLPELGYPDQAAVLREKTKVSAFFHLRDGSQS